MGASKQYALLAQGEPDESSENLLSSESTGSQRNWFSVVILFAAALVMSLTINLFFAFQWMRVPNSEVELSKYARLPRDVPTVRMRNYTYDSHDRAVEDASWDAPIVQPENGFIALDESFVEEMGLEHSMRWPWDTTKGVYILTSSHELHCVHVLRETVNQAHDGLPVRWDHEHVIHCLNVLRESIMCNADDTPMYTGALHANRGEAHPRAGIGMVKMCRDWNKLQMWARERSACWKPYKTDDPTFPEIDRYKFCPDGSRPWEELDGAEN